MIFKLDKKEGSCCYEEWDKKSKSLVVCNETTNVKAGKNYICREHLPFALAMDKKADTRGKKNREITHADFIMYVDGCTE